LINFQIFIDLPFVDWTHLTT